MSTHAIFHRGADVRGGGDVRLPSDKQFQLKLKLVYLCTAVLFTLFMLLHIVKISSWLKYVWRLFFCESRVCTLSCTVPPV